MRNSSSGTSGEKPIKPTTDDLIQVLENVRLCYILSRFGSLDSTHEWSSVLSLGEQQRLAFARLLLSKPKVVLLDESTSALDEANEVFLNTYSSLSLYSCFCNQCAKTETAIHSIQVTKHSFCHENALGTSK